METALKKMPVMDAIAPEGVLYVNGDWYFEEYAKGNGVTSLGLGNEKAAACQNPMRKNGFWIYSVIEQAPLETQLEVQRLARLR